MRVRRFVEVLGTDPCLHCGRDRVARQEHRPEERLLPAHGDALHPRPFSTARAADLAVDDLAQPPGPSHEGALGLVDDAAHLVLAVEGLARRRADLAEDDEALPVPVAQGHEQQEVGEAQVGEQAPRRAVDPALR